MDFVITKSLFIPNMATTHGRSLMVVPATLNLVQIMQANQSLDTVSLMVMDGVTLTSLRAENVWQMILKL